MNTDAKKMFLDKKTNYFFPAARFFSVSSIRTLMLIQGRLEHTETNLIHFKWEMT